MYDVPDDVAMRDVWTGSSKESVGSHDSTTNVIRYPQSGKYQHYLILQSHAAVMLITIPINGGNVIPITVHWAYPPRSWR
jgi:hypothetical protein